jgi:pimeloyl-ACP methyl ester carboxylesterase
MTIILLVFGGALGLGALYAWLLWRVGQAPARESVAGEAYRIGACWVYRLPAASGRAHRTVVAMHGFLQSPAYFTRLYSDCVDTELILVGSGDYHPALAADEEGDNGWAQAPAARLGTIAYDAEVLAQAMAHLAGGETVWVHGHSRGGAVVVEAARQQPASFHDKHFILEAPVLPLGNLFRPLPRGTVALVPCLLPAWRRDPMNARVRPVLGRLRDERKQYLMAAMPFNPRRAVTVMRNLTDIHAWMRGASPADLRTGRDCVVLITPQDRILDPAAMERSAAQAGDAVRIQTVRGVSHFISLDRPSVILDYLDGS